jgi:hypothetical protein
MSNTKEEILYKNGNYRVKVDSGKYAVVNNQTGVVEESTTRLYEAIRLCKILDAALIDAMQEPAPKQDWGRVAADLPIDISFH